MKLRQALLEQAPSLALQRAATDEIAALDSENRDMAIALERLLYMLCSICDQLNICPATTELDFASKSTQTVETVTVTAAVQSSATLINAHYGRIAA